MFYYPNTGGGGKSLLFFFCYPNTGGGSKLLSPYFFYPNTGGGGKSLSSEEHENIPKVSKSSRKRQLEIFMISKFKT